MKYAFVIHLFMKLHLIGDGADAKTIEMRTFSRTNKIVGKNLLTLA